MLRMLRVLPALGAFVIACFSSNAIAQIDSYLYGGGFIPIVAETSSYQSQIFIHNLKPVAQTISVIYTGATTSATPGVTGCNAATIGPGSVLKTSLGSLCPSLNPGSNFGVVQISGNNYMAIYSRVQTPSGNGFSVDGYETSSYCCGSVREVIGLVRQAAAPTYQSNCFVHNPEDYEGRIVVTLTKGDGALIATKVIDLEPKELIRMLDVFAWSGAPAGNYSNVRASFESITPIGGGSSVDFLAFCTVQNNTSFDADFRVAKYHF